MTAPTAPWDLQRDKSQSGCLQLIKCQPASQPPARVGFKDKQVSANSWCFEARRRDIINLSSWSTKGNPKAAVIASVWKEFCVVLVCVLPSNFDWHTIELRVSQSARLACQKV